MLSIFIDADNIPDPAQLQDFGLLKALLGVFGQRCELIVRGNHCGAWKQNWAALWSETLAPDAVDVKVVCSAPQMADADLLAMLLERRPKHVVLLSNDVLLRQAFAALCARLGLSFYGGVPAVAVKAPKSQPKPKAKPKATAPAAPAEPADARKLLQQWLQAHPKFKPQNHVPENALQSLAQKSGLPFIELVQAEKERQSIVAARESLARLAQEEPVAKIHF